MGSRLIIKLQKLTMKTGQLPDLPFPMALWGYGRGVVQESCNEPEYAVVSNSRTRTIGI
jgi:hypothetical protein